MPQEPGRRRAHARAARPRRGGARGPGRGGRLRRRQHLCVHRPGQAGVDRDDPRVDGLEGPGAGPAAGGDRVSAPALRRGAPCRAAGGRRPRRDRGAATHRGRGAPAGRAGGLGRGRAARLRLPRRRPARAPRRGAVRLREDRRGVQHGLHLLRDPAHARPAPEPAPRRRRGRGGAARAGRGPGGRARLPGHAGLGEGPAGAGALGLRRPPPRALRDADPLAPLSLPPPGARDGRADREARTGPRPALRRHADPARRRRGAARHAARGDAAAHGGDRRRAAGGDPGRDSPHDRARRLPGRDRGRLRDAARVPRRGALRSRGELRLLRRGGDAGGRAAGPGPRRGRRGPGAARPGVPGPAGLGALRRRCWARCTRC